MKTQILLTTALISALSMHSVHATDMNTTLNAESALKKSATSAVQSAQDSVKKTATSVESKVKTESTKVASDAMQSTEKTSDIVNPANDMKKASSDVKKNMLNVATEDDKKLNAVQKELIKSKEDAQKVIEEEKKAETGSSKKTADEQANSFVNDIADEATGTIKEAEQGILSTIFSFFK
jgi:hypothetical protein